MKRTNAHIPEEMGLPLFDQAEGAPAPAPFSTPFDELAKRFEDVPFSPDPIREVIKASPLTIEQADALRRGEALPSVRLRDPQVRGSVEEPRLSAQCRAILERLQKGKATNKELAAISLKYTGRISDLRAAGVEVDVVERDRSTGVTVYALRSK